MNFYKIEKIENNVINSTGVEIMLFSKMVKLLEKKNIKQLDDIIGRFIVFVNDATFEGDFFSLNKKTNFKFIEPNEIVKLNKENNIYFLSIINGLLHINNSVEKIEKAHLDRNNDIKKQKLSNNEQVALNWLDYGKTGSSSLAICSALFPKLKKLHYKLKEDIFSVPLDSSDFNRCYVFVKQLDNVDLSPVSNINPIWNKIITNWDTLVNHLEKNEYSQLNEQLKEYQKIKVNIKI